MLAADGVFGGEEGEAVGELADGLEKTIVSRAYLAGRRELVMGLVLVLFLGCC